MAAAVEIPFAAQTGAAGVTQNSQETLRNMYAEVVPSGHSRLVRRQRPGISSVYALTGEKRCIAKNGDMHYLVVDATLSSFDGTTLTPLGLLATSTGPCTMAFNDNGEILVSDNNTLKFWNGSALADVTVPVGFIPGPVTYLGGFGVVADLSTPGRFYSTASEDFSDVDALDFATAESAPDALVRPFADHNELWLYGADTTEVWALSGGADFPFQPITNAKLERGCGAAMTVVAEDNTLFSLGDDWLVYRANGYVPAVVSNPVVAAKIAGVSVSAMASAYAFIYTHNGSKFYTLTFPGELTLQLNLATMLWNEARTYGQSEWVALGGAGHSTGYLLTAAGIGELTAGLCTDDGAVMVREAISAPGWAAGRKITVGMFRLDCEVGRASVDVDASVMLRVALDGETFKNERTRALGLTGDYRRRVTWRGIGQGEKPTLWVSVSDPVEWSIMSALAEIAADVN